MLNDILPMLVGPAAAVIALLGVLWGIYRLVDIRLIPAWQATATRHLDQVDRLIDSHEKDREAFLGGLQGVKDEFRDHADRVEDALGKVEAKVSACPGVSPPDPKRMG